MAAPTIFRSTDTGAPVLTGSSGTLVDLLDACLVNGYGGTYATDTLTSSGVAPTDGDTVTVNGTVYTFKTALTPSANQVLIGTAAVSLSNLAACMMGWGVAGTNYATGSTIQTSLHVTGLTATVLTLQARAAGTAGNSLTLARSAVTLTVATANFTGGSGTVTTAGLGWAKSFSGTSGGVYRPPAGTRFFLYVNDNGPGAGLGKEARFRAAETATSYNADTTTGLANLFPTAAQLANGMFIRKSVTLDQTARPWVVIGDDRTVYVLAQTGDSAGVYLGWMFGDFFSLLPSDAYKCQIIGRTTENSGTITLDQLDVIATTAFTAIGGHYFARGYPGTGGSVNISKYGDSLAANNSAILKGTLAYPNPVDGCVYASRVYLLDNATAPVGHRRGYMRGLYHFTQPVASVIDGDTFTSTSGDYSGKSFIIFKATGNTGVYMIETTAWDTST